MAAEFSGCVDLGVQLSKRIYYGKDLRPSLTLVEPQTMTRSASAASSSFPTAAAVEEYMPKSPMAYAVVAEPAVVDNPDVPSYQPYVHGRCEPPALVPLHMHAVSAEIEAHLDTAFVSVAATWRVHCIMASRCVDCRIAIPMGEKGSLLGVEVEVTGRSYRTQMIGKEDIENVEKAVKAQDGKLLKGQIYTFKVPQVEGGGLVSIKATWSQRIEYELDQFCIRVPFSFPPYVNPVGRKISKQEKISLNVNPGTGIEVLCKSSSHPLKNLKRQSGKLSFSHDAEVPVWSNMDFSFSYTLSSAELFGGVLLQSPYLRDLDDREMFCLYLFPGTNHITKVFKKEVVFVIDISGSMKGGPIESVKIALLASLSNLDPQDTFNIIAFNRDTRLFAPSMEPAAKETILKAIDWVETNLVPNGGTNILLPLEQAIKLLAETSDSIPFIFLVTDGSVEEEREICNVVKRHISNAECSSPCICTFGIGPYCNHYFLQMLAQIGKGYYDAAYDLDAIDSRIQRLFASASSIILSNITIKDFEHLDSLEIFPSKIPDLSSGNPLIVSGRFHGNLPNIIKLSGTLADTSNFTVDLKTFKANGLPLNKVLARRHIDMLTSQAWINENKELEEKVANISKQTGVPSEYTFTLLVQSDQGKKAPDSNPTKEVNSKVKDWKRAMTSREREKEKVLFLGNLGFGFGDLSATASNKPSVTEEVKPSELPTDMLLKAASNMCSQLVNRLCCLCFIRSCSYMNDRVAVVLAQLCTCLACCECINCCYELCA